MDAIGRSCLASIALGLALLVGCTSVQRQETRTQEFRSHCVPSHSTAKPGETVTLRFILENTSRQTLTVCTYPGFCIEFLAEHILKPDGSKLSRIRRGRPSHTDRIQPGRDHFRSLNPGETISSDHQFTVPPDTEATAFTYRLDFWAQHNGKNHGINAWTGEVVSTPCEIKVQRP